MKTRPSSRRNFLLAASLGGAGAVAATQRQAAPAAKGEAVAAAPEGYRASAHILKYYKTTEV